MIEWDNKEKGAWWDTINLSSAQYEILTQEQKKIGDTLDYVYKNSYHCLLKVLGDFKNPDSELSILVKLIEMAKENKTSK